MAHDELIALSTDEKYAVCREYITEALSYKLNRYENAIKAVSYTHLTLPTN